MFWELERHAATKARLHDGSNQRTVSYAELLAMVDVFEKLFASDHKLLVGLFCDNSLSGIAAYLATLRTGHAVMLTNVATDDSLKARVADLYEPEIVVSSVPSKGLTERFASVAAPLPGVFVFINQQPPPMPIHPDTAVLLSSSGTTGSPKLIRLSRRNMQANAASIAQYLALTPGETAITSLPISYSYGLSVLNSHLLVGANLVCTNASVVTKDFWTLFNEHQCTSLAGVPYTYTMLEQLRFAKMNLPSLRTLTQAGGRLAPDKIRLFAELTERRQQRFFVMYGQTEATARISYVPCDRLADKIGSVGIAIPGGTLHIRRDGVEITEPDVEGEVVYDGPNVMLGYAESRQCLSKGDELQGRLFTGDLGHRDRDGFLYITGRLKRFIKVFGLRLNLDEVERMVENSFGCQVACVGDDENLHVLLKSADKSLLEGAKQRIITLYKLHHSVVHIHGTALLPATASGKKDYGTMERNLGLHERC